MQNLLSHEIFKLAKITQVAAFALAAILLACSSRCAPIFIVKRGIAV